MSRPYAIYDVFHRRQAEGQSARGGLRRLWPLRCGDAGDRRRIQPFGDGLRSAAREPCSHGAIAHFHTRPRTALRRPPDRRDGPSRSPNARDRSGPSISSACWRRKSARCAPPSASPLARPPSPNSICRVCRKSCRATSTSRPSQTLSASAPAISASKITACRSGAPACPSSWSRSPAWPPRPPSASIQKLWTKAAPSGALLSLLPGR